MPRVDDLERQPLVGPVAQLLHDARGPRSRFFSHVRPVARHGVQHLLRHAPHAVLGRLHGAADIGVALVQDVDEGLAVERQHDGPPEVGIVERRRIAVDDQVGGVVHRGDHARALGIWLLMSFSKGIVTSHGKVMSNLPDMKLSIAVARLGTMVNSMPSR